ncbi:MAG: GDP-mannose 4,6-dehydratase [Candidatus Omnitrophica bacterium]|nr:GDP-mannose 4,6-dehydratase [Candidatus Omnitrophota bacterium]
MIKDLKGRRVLITGAEGFIGSHLSRRLYRLGARVHIIVHPASSLWRISDILDKIKVWPVDLLDSARLTKVLHKIKPLKIYHLAANTDHRRILSFFDKIFHDNIYAALNLLQSSTWVDMDCFVNTGTCEEYGTGNVPFEEGQRECPVSPYSASKTCITHTCMMLQRSFGLPVVTVRPFLTYGPAQGQDMFIPSLILSCLRNKNFKMSPGRQTREFNYVDDMVEGFIKASVTPGAIGEVINLGNGKEHRIIDVARMVKKLTKAKIELQTGILPYRPGEKMHFYSSSSKAKRILNWESKTDLEEGLIRTINWYKAHYDRKR